MLKDLVPQFSEVLAESPRIVEDNYELKEGIYIKLPLSKTFSKEKTEYKVVKKQHDEVYDALFKWFHTADRLSSVLNDDMNKCIDLPGKKVHSTNAFTLFWKKDYVFGKDGESETDEAKNHFLSFYQKSIPKMDDRLFELYPIKARKRAEKEAAESARETFFHTHYEPLMTYLSSEERVNKREQIAKFWELYFDEVMEWIRNLVKEHKVTNYIKVFFDIDLKEYAQEYEIYVLPRIFNVNEFNELLNNKIVGLPAYDVSMNAKKPFFEMKTRKTEVPTRVSLEEALRIKDFYQWLQQRGKFKEITLPFHEPFGPGTGKKVSAKSVAKGAYYLSLDKNGSIQYFENVPFEPDEAWSLVMDNVLERKEKVNGVTVMKAYEPIYKKSALRAVMNKLFFNGFMPNNLLDPEAPKPKVNIFTVEMVSIYTMTRQALFDYIVKDTKGTIEPFIKKYSMQLMENQMLQTVQGLRFHKVTDAFHLYLALLKDFDYEEGINMENNLKQVYNSLKDKLQEKEGMVFCENDAEFFFLAGQLGYYLLSQSAAEKENKNYGLAEPILKARNVQILQNKLNDLFDTYKHAILTKYVAFNNAMAMVQGYETNAKIVGSNRSMLIAGLCANNLLYQKSEKSDN
ncbi:hypothetical protein [Massilibacterium senegalense]|uniref:hypothetical protein n=1 Tax=Massilibacterium senegalense TaxID=1632858 RepID=UPI0007854D39|nr:hypothetical protein [Massilibacterium senegalense]